MESVELPFQRPLRRLQQENGVAIVQQPADFVTALAFGEEHIELRSHLDYTLFAHVEQERVWAPVLFPETVKTLKGNCSEPIPTQAQLGLTGPPMVEGKQGMCLLVFVGDCFSLVAPGRSQVLLDNLYLRQNVFPERFSTETAVVKVERSEFDAPLEQSPALWMTNVTVQGSGEGNVRGLQLSSRLYAEDCVFSALGDGVPVIDVRRRAQLSTAGSDSTSASFLNCWFQDNTVQDDDGIIKAREFTGVQLRKSFFVGNDAAHLLYSDVDSTTGPGTFYSDALRNVWHSGKGINVPTGSLWEASVSGYEFLSTNDTFYVEANEHQIYMAESTPSEGLGGGAIAGIAVAASAALLAVVAIVVALLFRHRRAQKRHEEPSSDTQPMHDSMGTEKPGSYMNRQLPPRGQPMVYGNHQLSMAVHNTTPARSVEPSYVMNGAFDATRLAPANLPGTTQSGDEELPMPPGGTGGSMANAITKSVDTNSHSQVSQVVAFDEISREQKMMCTTIKAQPPPSDAKLDDRKAFLKSQLDGLMWATVLDSLTLITGRNSRMSGGQAVVQIAEDRGTRIEYAMKFFLSRAAFEHELALYADNTKPLGAFLPEVHSIIDPSKTTFLDAAGVPLPPCIIMEKGESLDKWAASCTDGLDMVTGLQVLTHVAERLSDLHAAGYVHRDIKPANIMWLPRKKRWTLIDFGCAARTGTSASNSFTPVFASPEVIRTHQEGGKKIEVTEAMDSWSVGILALELFTGKPAFSQFQTREKTMAMITGFDPAPWEAESTRTLILHRLGSLKRPILRLLDRNPSTRLTMDGFHEACCRVLALTSDSNYSAALY